MKRKSNDGVTIMQVLNYDPSNEFLTSFFLIPKIQLDNAIFENSAIIDRNEICNFSDFISLLKSHLVRDKLSEIQKEFSDELAKRTSSICEMIPGILFIFYRTLSFFF